ncbi:MAG: hypothetical protein ACLVC1_11170 [Mediterraneibacter gnavus]
MGDRYQMISLHENLLFSYFETPRDREQVNISRRPEPSEATKEWEAVVPESHFYHFPEANGENFLIILTVFLWDKGIQQKQDCIILYLSIRERIV